MSAAKKQFLHWLRENDPYLYNVARYKHANEGGLGTVVNPQGTSSFFSSVVDTVKKLGTSVLQYKSQKKILDLQLKRAEQNLPPIDASMYTPTVKVEAAVTPEMEQQARRVGIDLVKQGAQEFKPIFFGALILGGFFLLKGRK